MFIFIKLAWRNIFRNTRRTLLAGTAIGLGLAGLIYVDALMIGMGDQMIIMVTETWLGQAQVHVPGFMETLEIDKFIPDGEQLVEKLREEPEVKNVSGRIQSFGMINSPADSGSIMLFGIEPNTEREISKLDEAIIKGAYFSEEEPQSYLPEVIIGDKLAETLEVDIGDKVVVTLAKAGTGELGQNMYLIGGIFDFNINEMDGGAVFMRLSDARELTGVSGLHEIVINFQNLGMAEDGALPIWNKYNSDKIEIKGWHEIMPELKSVMQMMDYNKYIMAFMLFVVVALGILNTLFMSFYERMFEFGVLRAIGARPKNLFGMIMLEGASLGVISIIIGSVVGFAVTLYSAHAGIDYSGIEFAGMTITKSLYPKIMITQYIVYPMWLMFFTLVVALYPAFYAARLTPAKAMRKSF